MKQIQKSHLKRIQGGFLPMLLTGAWVMGSAQVTSSVAGLSSLILTLSGATLAGVGMKKHYDAHQ